MTFGFIVLEMLNRFEVRDFGHNVLKKVPAEQFSASNLPLHTCNGQTSNIFNSKNLIGKKFPTAKGTTLVNLMG